MAKDTSFARATPVLTDDVRGVDDPGGTPLTRRFLLSAIYTLFKTSFDAVYAALASPTFTGTVTLPKTTEIQDTSADHQYVLAVSELTADRTVTLPLLTGNDVFVFADFIQTLTNKRVKPRIYTTTSIAGTPGVLTPEIATYDYFEITAQAAALNIANHSTSTPTGGEKMVIAITSDATPRALTYGTAYVAKGGTALPTTTVASKTTTLGFMYNAGLAKWNLLAVAQEA